MKFPQKQIYFFYGNEEERLNQARVELVSLLLSREEREENYVEFSPSPAKKYLPLASVMPELLAELGTMSFFPDSKRVVVVYNLQELYRNREKPLPMEKTEKKTITSEAYFITYLQDQLPQTNNVLILMNVEDLEENIRIDENSTLVKALVKLGHHEHKQFSSTALRFKLDDALRERNLQKTIEITRSWMQKDEDSAKRGIFQVTLKQIILMLQAKIRLKRKDKLNVQSDLAKILFPQDLKYNIFKEKDFVQKKIMDGQERYTTGELMEALQKLLPVNQYLYPLTTDVYVPDFQIVMERFFVELMSRRR